MNEQEQMSKNKTSVALSSVMAGFLLTAGKFVVGLMTGSMGILSEAAHSLLDMGAAVITYFAVRVSDKPADEEHHYGHGKIEALSALIETALLFITSGWIIYEAVKRLMSGNIEVEATWYAFAIVAFSIVIDFSRSRALMKVAKETGSQALEADALHFRTDIWSSAVVFIGLICVLFDIKGADAVAALFVALIVIKVGWDMGKRTFDVLIDTAPDGLADKTKDILMNVPGIIDVDHVRARMMGPTASVDALIVVGRKLNTEALHDIIKTAKEAVMAEFPETDIIIHSKSIQLSTETIVESIHVLGHKHGFSIHHVVVDILNDKKFIDYDLEVLHTLTVKDAHEKATEFEALVKAELGDDVEINTHIDPSIDESSKSEEVSDSEMKKIEEQIQEGMKHLPKLENAHNILTRKTEGKIAVVVHCYADPEMTIDEAHDEATTLEHFLIGNKHCKIARAVVHVEPKE